ncbi:MAG TPA: L,D-transpeptidase family protein [Chthoniobacterales bacterium]|jgi:lipoprotein-anchoring transpeptidase ErfK/SrfK|nr:L,D-transpeptidase family protein [Chthoniobacterales bacterium]
MKPALFILLALFALAVRVDAGWFDRHTPTPPPTPIPVRKALPPLTPTPSPTPKPTPRRLVALPVYDEETSVRLQIFLDNNEFGPGKIDGRMGEFFGKALVAYKKAHGLEPTGAVDAQLIAQVPEPYTNYTIRPEDENFVGEVASKPAEQAKLKAMKYGSLLEFVAERYHAAEDFLRKINPEVDLEKLKPGDTVKVPNVQPFEIEKLSEKFIPANPAFATRQIFIDTRENFLEVRDGDKLLAEFPITPGSKTLPAPKGVWKILGIATLPWFRHDEGVLNYGVRTGDFYNIPPGPNNPVGILWMGLNKPGIGIHGTNNPETIGRAGSHGCIRTANWDAARLKDMVSPGNVVTIF